MISTAAQNFMQGADANIKAAAGSTAQTAHTIKAEAQNLKKKIGLLDRQANFLGSIAERLEERDARSKWDWATLGCAMVVAAGLAAAAGYFFAADQIRANDFNRSIRLITQDDDAYWCNQAQASIVQDSQGTHYCAVAMSEYQEPEATGGNE